MIDFFVTTEAASEEALRDFKTDVSREGAVIKNEVKEGDFYHFFLQGNWSCYRGVADIIKSPETKTYRIHSIEHFEE